MAKVVTITLYKGVEVAIVEPGSQAEDEWRKRGFGEKAPLAPKEKAPPKKKASR